MVIREGTNQHPWRERPPYLTILPPWQDTKMPLLGIHTHTPNVQVFDSNPRPRRPYLPQIRSTQESDEKRSNLPCDHQRTRLDPTLRQKPHPPEPIGPMHLPKHPTQTTNSVSTKILKTQHRTNKITLPPSILDYTYKYNHPEKIQYFTDHHKNSIQCTPYYYIQHRLYILNLLNYFPNSAHPILNWTATYLSYSAVNRDIH